MTTEHVNAPLTHSFANIIARLAFVHISAFCQRITFEAGYTFARIVSAMRVQAASVGAYGTLIFHALGIVDIFIAAEVAAIDIDAASTRLTFASIVPRLAFVHIEARKPVADISRLTETHSKRSDAERMHVTDTFVLATVGHRVADAAVALEAGFAFATIRAGRVSADGATVAVVVLSRAFVDVNTSAINKIVSRITSLNAAKRANLILTHVRIGTIVQPFGAFVDICASFQRQSFRHETFGAVAEISARQVDTERMLGTFGGSRFAFIDIVALVTIAFEAGEARTVVRAESILTVRQPVTRLIRTFVIV